MRWVAGSPFLLQHSPARRPSPLTPLPPHSPRPGEGNPVGVVLLVSLFSRLGGGRWEKRAGVMRVLGGRPPAPPTPPTSPSPPAPPAAPRPSSAATAPSRISFPGCESASIWEKRSATPCSPASPTTLSS